jgi:predicted ATPase/class 3 adenylate cyclase/Tfp pilus assembly protein PilF
MCMKEAEPMPALPSGTVTFLFTDIEGSTRLWEEKPEAMRVALARHDVLLRVAIEANSGIVFKTIGDAFCAAFATAPEALSSALVLQHALLAEAWPDPIRLRVRAALHTGAVELRDNDYFGQPLNRVARLLSAGYGGQILLSDVAQELTRDHLPPAVSLKPLGEHRLRDLARPETVFQLLHPDLPAEFPPLRSLDNADLPNNLPQQLTSFIGREKESAEVQALLRKTRLLTLTGSGGSGKTRLSLQVAADVLEDYPDGVWLIELAALTDPTLVTQALAQTLGLREETGKLLFQTLTEHLKPKRTLLVLDNCEHLLSAITRLADGLLRACPGVKILANSREGMGTAGEVVYRVPSLSLPDPKKPQTVVSISQYESVRLFVERAAAVLPTFTVTNANAPALASVCHRLDGIPLAIELAAARVRVLSLEQIAARLDDRFRFLTGGSRSALPRQQTLRALIDWSFELLTLPEQTMLARLAVFAGGWTLEAAEAVTAGDGIEEWEVLDLLTGLVDKSLALVQTQGESTRYLLQETVRQYARDLPLFRETEAEIRGRHRDCFMALAEEADPYLDGPQQKEWFARLEAEHDNFRAVLDFCAQDPEPQSATAAVRLTAAVYWFWFVRGYISEGRAYLAAALERDAGGAGPKVRARALTGAGILAREQGDYVEAYARFTQSLELAREQSDLRGVTGALNNLGMLALDQGDYEAARPLYAESLELARAQGDRARIAAALNNMGTIVFYQQDYPAAKTLYAESLALARQLQDRQRIATCSNNLGLVARHEGDYAGAHTLYAESLTLFQELEDRRGIAYVLEMLAALAAVENRAARSVCLSGAAQAVREATGSTLPAVDQQERYDRLTALQETLGNAAYAAAWEEGQAMVLEQATAYALKEAQG